MTVLYGNLQDVTGQPFDQQGTAVVISATQARPAMHSDALTLVELARIPMEDSGGHFETAELDPGPVIVMLEGGVSHGQQWKIGIPDDGERWNLAALIGEQVEWEPEVTSRAEAAARESSQHADRAEGEADRAETAADRVGSAEAVVSARDESVAARDAARSAQAEAEGARGGAESAQGKAEVAESAAASSASAASSSESAAAGSADAARADAVATAADRVKTTEDAASTAADLDETVKNRVWSAMARDRAETAADKAAGSATTATTQADRAKSEADRASAAADLADGAAVQAVTERVDTLLSGVPEAYDTLSEIAAKLADQDDVASAMTAQIGQKVDRTSVGNRLYGTDSGGNQAQVQYVSGAMPLTVPYRGTGGTLQVGEPTDSSHAATKNYVDAVKTTADAALPASKIQVVTALPESPVEGTIYLVTGE